MSRSAPKPASPQLQNSGLMLHRNLKVSQGYAKWLISSGHLLCHEISLESVPCPAKLFIAPFR